ERPYSSSDRKNQKEKITKSPVSPGESHKTQAEGHNDSTVTDFTEESIASSTPVKPILQMFHSDSSSLNSMESIEKSTQEPMASSSAPIEPIIDQEIVHNFIFDKIPIYIT
ncbi:uncharacterized protein LOC112454473, partial [Temnothorax curvispinosus]|uniref:Uncharacterized protein LOC112454473 n=1 Tax=Temnothorax curvispinosus TaxID=300111 RepID=A0A6J1PQT8_9HYME